MYIGLDTETTGLDLRHGCKPFLIQLWSTERVANHALYQTNINARFDPDEVLAPLSALLRATTFPQPSLTEPHQFEGEGYYLLGDYKPNTRDVVWNNRQLEKLAHSIEGHSLILHNAFFDLLALAAIGVYIDFESPQFSTVDLFRLAAVQTLPAPRIRIQCRELHDTTLMCHAYDCRGPRGLKDAATHYLLIPPGDEDVLAHYVNQSRSICRKHFPDWKLGVDLKDKDQTKYDYALPITIYQHLKQLSTRDRNALPEVVKSWTSQQALSPIAYGCLDTYRTLLLFHVLQPLLTETNRLDQYHLAVEHLIPCFKMQSCGVRLSNDMRPLHRELSRNTFHRKKEVVRTAAKLAPNLFSKTPFNPNSNPQLSTLLFSREGFNLPVIERSKKTGKPSTSSSVRRQLAYSLLDKPYRKAQDQYNFLKLLTSWDDDDPNLPFPEPNTGLDAWKKSVEYLSSYLSYSIADPTGPTTSRYLFPSFNPTGTDLTRYSSSSPNGQNIGKKTRVPLRKAFGPSPDFTWYAIDYSQLELRLFAAACQDETLLSSFENGRDFHELVACEMFNLDPEEITSQKRTSAKYVNFGLIYGAGPARIDGLAGFKGAYNRYCDNFPRAAEYMAEQTEFAHKKGYVETLFGYPIQLGHHPAYKSVNCVVQGTAGSLVKYAMHALDTNPDSPVDWENVRIILNVHDELIFEVSNSLPSIEHANIITTVMQIMADQGRRINIDTPVDCSIITDTWMNKEDYDPCHVINENENESPQPRTPNPTPPPPQNPNPDQPLRKRLRNLPQRRKNRRNNRAGSKRRARSR